MQLYIVGQYRGKDAAGYISWDFQGVFDSREAAIAACTTPMYFVGPALLNESIVDQVEVWPGLFYPQEVKP